MSSLLHGQAEARGLGWPHRPVRAPLRQAQEVVVTTVDPERASALFDARLAALVARHFGVERSDAATFPGGAARRSSGTAWVFVDEDTPRALGRSLAWARRSGVTELHLVVERDAGLLAARAASFADPATVWWLQGRELHPADPEPPARPDPPRGVDHLASVLAAAGLDVVAEHGYLAGELRGLEVARAENGRVEVGVGAADRELTAMVHGELSADAALERVVSIVDAKRRPGAPRHPLNQLVPERWLRWTLRSEPRRVGLDELRPSPSPRPRRGLRDRDLAIALGDGAVVACSVGVDLDLVPAAAEARDVLAPGARLLLVVPERDDHPVTRALAASLREPAEVVTVAGEWRS